MPCRSSPQPLPPCQGALRHENSVLTIRHVPLNAWLRVTMTVATPPTNAIFSTALEYVLGLRFCEQRGCHRTESFSIINAVTKAA
eukprot:1198910-Rhodomonas_salina.3